ncbi:MAG: hypothetical protein WC593_15020 [Methanoregula sp.]
MVDYLLPFLLLGGLAAPRTLQSLNLFCGFGPAFFFLALPFLSPTFLLQIKKATQRPLAGFRDGLAAVPGNIQLFGNIKAYSVLTCQEIRNQIIGP